MSSLRLCLLLLLAASVQVLAGGKLSEDPVFIIKCCVEKTVPKDDQSSCNAQLCQAQASAVEAIKNARLKPTDEDFFERVHRAGEGRDLAEKAEKMVAQGKKPSGEIQAFALLEDQTLLKKLWRQSRNPFYNDARWPKGVIPYKFGAGLSLPHTGDKANVFRAMQTSMEAWSSKTCIRFKKDDTATFELDMINELAAFVSSRGGYCGKYSVRMALCKDCGMTRISHHEFGHLIGLQHTNNRRNPVATFHEPACRVQYSSAGHECEPGKEDRKATYTTDCANGSATVTGLQTDGILFANYSGAGADLQKCVTEVCLRSWMFQYTPLAGAFNPDLPQNQYEVNSIMHYPIDGVCLTAPRGVVQARVRDQILQYDLDSVNLRYECYKITVKFNILQSKEIWIHPDLSEAEALADIAQSCGFDKWDDASWKLKNAANKVAIAPMGKMAPFLKANNIRNLCIERNSFFGRLISGC